MASSKWTSSAFSLKATLYFHLRCISTQQTISSVVIREQQLQDLSLFWTVGDWGKEEKGGSGQGREGCKKKKKTESEELKAKGMKKAWWKSGEGKERGWTGQTAILRWRRERDDKHSEKRQDRQGKGEKDGKRKEGEEGGGVELVCFNQRQRARERISRTSRYCQCVMLISWLWLRKPTDTLISGMTNSSWSR